MSQLTDNDLLSIQEARTLTDQAFAAAQELRGFSQDAVDRIAESMARAGFEASERLAKMASEETGFGRWEDKLAKNHLATANLWAYIKDMKTVGFLDDPCPVRRVAEPMGVVAAIIPSTNPTSTALYKAIIALKARNSVVLSPHPAAVNCIRETAAVMQRAAMEGGAPEDSVLCMTVPELAGTNELMSLPKVGVVLATGGTALVKAAYSSGKPAYGVGPGNVPAFIEKTADPVKAVNDITVSKCFDYGTVCSSEQSIVVDRSLDSEVRALLKSTGSHFCSPEEISLLEKAMILPGLKVNPRIVGQSSAKIAEIAGFSVPEDTKMLVVEIGGVGEDYPLSIEKLSPVICYYVVDGWEEGCEMCLKIIRHGGLGHTMALHSRDDNVVERFALEKPVMRVLVNTPATHGAVGLTTALPPALTLGCGTWGGSITGDNVTPMHLLNFKRLALETTPLQAGEGLQTPDEAQSVRWRYDEQFRYRPVRDDSEPGETTANNSYGEGISEDSIRKIIADFKAGR